MVATRDEIIEQNIGLVHSCAHKFKGRGIEYDDLFGAGCLGLVKATDAFDWNRGVKFSTYAVPVILGEMRRLFRDGGTIKVSRTLKEQALKILRQREHFSNEHGREATVNEIAQIMQIDVSDVVQAIGALTPPISLTQTDDEGSESQIDIPVPSPEDLLSDLMSLKQMVMKLDEQDKSLINLRYFQRKTQSDTAKMLGMTQVQVSRREKKILLKLRDDLL